MKKRILLLIVLIAGFSIGGVVSYADTIEYVTDSGVVFEEDIDISNLSENINGRSTPLSDLGLLITFRTVNPPEKPYVKNKRFSHESYSQPFFSVEGNPKGILSISKSTTSSISVSSTFGVSKDIISAGTGINIGKSVSVSGSKSIEVPETYKGRKVKLGKMDIRIKYINYKVDVYKWNNARHSHYKAGEANIRVPSGVNIRHWFIFE